MRPRNYEGRNFPKRSAEYAFHTVTLNSVSVFFGNDVPYLRITFLAKDNYG